jgi:hypothetical protein
MNANEEVAPRAGRRRLWVFAPILLSLAALATAGVVLTRRHDDPGYQGLPIPIGPQPDLRWTMDPLPNGWVANGASEMMAQGFALNWNLTGSFRMTAYGTADDPTKPTLLLGVGDDMNSTGLNDVATDDLHRFEANGAVGLCGTGTFEVQICVVTKGGRRVQSHSRGVSAVQLASALMSVEVVNGAPTVPAMALPRGMAQLGSWHNEAPGALSAVRKGAVAAFIGFGGADGKASVQVGHAAQQDLALGFETGEPHTRVVDGVTYYEAELVPGYLRLVVWEHEAFAFQMLITGATQIDAVQLARALRPASASEWTAALTAVPRQYVRPPSSDPTVTETTWPTMGTDGPDASSIVDVPLVTRVEVLPGGGGLVFHAALPGGRDVPLTVLSTSDSVATSLDGAAFSVAGVPDAPGPLLNPVASATWSGAYVLTSDARAATMRVVRTNGDRYVVPLVPVPDGSGQRAAYLSVPAGQRWNVEVDDQFGTALDFIGLAVL